MPQATRRFAPSTTSSSNPRSPRGGASPRPCSPSESQKALPTKSQRTAMAKAPAQAPKKPDDNEEGGRQMFDKNTLRANHCDLFQNWVANYRQDKLEVDSQGSQGTATPPPLSGRSSLPAVQVFARKRPIFEKESKKADFDVVSVVPGSPAATKLVVHNCLFKADMKTPYVSHTNFEVDHVFSETATSQEVYQGAARDLVYRCCTGGAGTVLMFGQTGSGKTHTMTAIEEMAAHDLFQGATGQEAWLTLTFLELRGNRCFDLLAGTEAGESPTELRLREHGDGSYAAEGALEFTPAGPEELVAAMQFAHSRRKTSATDANDVSSRSHALCIVRLLKTNGQLLLIDCAGTERRKDSMYHSNERQQESVDINASLYALKECIRYLSTSQKVPSHAYRASALTKVLASTFMRGGDARFSLICTASPCASDTEHTISTLRTGMTLSGRGSESEEKEEMPKKARVMHLKQWTPEQVRSWVMEVNGGKFKDVADALPSSFTGQMLCRINDKRCVQLCGGNERRGRQLFDLLHQEIRRIEAERRPSV